MEIVADEKTMEYFNSIKRAVDRALSIAKEARKKGLDPSNDVEVSIAEDVASRVEGILGIEGIADIIRSLEASGQSRVDIAFEITKRIARGELFKGTKEQLLDKAVRVGVAVLTEGVLVAPTEGISEIKLKKNDDNSEYVAVFYAGPIRSAGGTVAALSVVLADIARRELNIGPWKPSKKVINRIVEEVNIYDARAARLQYKPPDEHVEIIVKNLPVEVEGDPTHDFEVSVNRDIPSISTNRIRGGVPLVICEGIAQKAAKVYKYTMKLGLEDWGWIKSIIKEKKSSSEDKPKIVPIEKYLTGTVAGRPIFAYPSRPGGFRLRYGRSRTSGIMAKNIHPAAMILLGGFPVYGTQLKIERPGKGMVVGVSSAIEGPIVKLKDGTVKQINSIEEAESINSEVDEILFLGDILVPFGDFSKSNSLLAPPGYVEEWWEEDVKSLGIEPPILTSVNDAFEFASSTNTPLHPRFLFYWDTISVDQLSSLIDWIVSDGSIENGRLIIKSKSQKRVLELLGVEHTVDGDNVVVDEFNTQILIKTLNLSLSNGKFERPNVDFNESSTVDLLTKLSGVKIKPKGGTFIGARMGRPEKAKERRMNGGVQVLFPTGRPGLRSIMKLYSTLKGRGEKYINVSVGKLRCKKCGKPSLFTKCPFCGGEADVVRVCPKCGARTFEKVHCGVETRPMVVDMKVDLVGLIDSIRSSLGFAPRDLKGVEGLTSKEKIPERLEKGFFRAKHDVYVFKDGTSRFDSTDAPLTHFRPYEIGLSVEKAKSLGYTHDWKGEPLTSEDQLVPLKVQDVILPETGAEYFVRVAKFIDDLLEHFYGLERFYNVEKKEDLIGHLVIGQSPHTSAGIVGRIIGITKANVGYAHPYFHMAKRRNTDGDEDGLMLLMDAFLNFSKRFLSATRGGTMDAPIVLTVTLDPREVDDEVHEMETVGRYPKEFYEAAEKISSPGDVKLETIKDRLGKPSQYDQVPFTHDGVFLDKGPTRSAYVKLNSIPEKIDAEIKVMSRIRAVDVRDAVEKVILDHFVPDIYGNLRGFSRQSFRCVKCNAKYRRVPLIGKCIRCGGNLTMTVHRGGVEKYLETALRLTDQFNLPLYLKQRLLLVKKEIGSVFEDDKVKQTGLFDFMA